MDNTLKDLNCSDKPAIIIFNKVDAFTYTKKDDDDLTPATRENISLDDLKKTWMAKDRKCIFISAREKTNFDELRQTVYSEVRRIHTQRFPYNDFLYQTAEEQEAERNEE